MKKSRAQDNHICVHVVNKLATNSFLIEYLVSISLGPDDYDNVL